MTRRDDLLRELQRRDDIRQELGKREQHRLALHEAAHCVSGYVLGLEPIKLSLNPRPVTLFKRFDENDLEKRHASIISSFAGIIQNPGNGGKDQRDVDRDIDFLEKHGIHYDNYYQDTEALLKREDVRSAIAAMADELIKKNKLDKNEI